MERGVVVYHLSQLIAHSPDSSAQEEEMMPRCVSFLIYTTLSEFEQAARPRRDETAARSVVPLILSSFSLPLSVCLRTPAH